jgi:hypothetical protein
MRFRRIPLQRMICKPRVFLMASGTLPASPGQPRNPSGEVELTFLRHPFESLGRILDPVLAVIAIGREQLDHLIGAAGARTGNIAGSEIDRLSNGEFMLQRPLHHAKMPAVLTVPAHFGRLENCLKHSTAEAALASRSGHGKSAIFAGFSER